MYEGGYDGRRGHYRVSGRSDMKELVDMLRQAKHLY